MANSYASAGASPAQSVRSYSSITSRSSYHRGLSPILLVGGGKGIWRKAQGLIERRIPFKVMAPALCDELTEAARRGDFEWIPRAYTGISDVGEARIIILGIGDAGEELRFAQELEAAGYLFSLLSDATRGNLQFGATAHKEGITLAVHSDYRLPEITQQLKTAWSETLPDGFEATSTSPLPISSSTTRGYR